MISVHSNKKISKDKKGKGKNALEKEKDQLEKTKSNVKTIDKLSSKQINDLNEWRKKIKIKEETAEEPKKLGSGLGKGSLLNKNKKTNNGI